MPLWSLEQGGSWNLGWPGSAFILRLGSRQKVVKTEMPFRKLVMEHQDGGPLVDGQEPKCFKAACRDFLRKVVLGSRAIARPSLWVSVMLAWYLVITVSMSLA